MPTIYTTHEVRFMQPGYWLIHETISNSASRKSGWTLWNAYALDGSYIGSAKKGWLLGKTKGIIPQRSENHNVAFIGQSVIDGKWYGWSHRAIRGFHRRRDAERFAGACHNYK